MLDKIILLGLALALPANAPALPAPSASGSEEFVLFQEPEYFSFDELKTLSKNPKPKGRLGEKLTRFFKTPAISNEAYFRGKRPRHKRNFRLGPHLNIASWNIEKSYHIREAIALLTSEENYLSMVDPRKAPLGSDRRKKILRQRRRLADADILVLQEMEVGIKRSDYLDAAREMANALGMNYAFAPQYLEIDPVNLGVDTIMLEDGSEDIEAADYYRVDPEKFKGVFGSAVLSKYPIKQVEVRPLRYQPYNWYESERKKIGFLEKTRRFGSKTVFKNELTREMKAGGGRHYFRVDLDVPELEGGTLTIINVHLEIKCRPKDRKKQLEEILEEIQSIRNPLILMGDFNAAPDDISPTSVQRVIKRTAKNPTTWFNAAVSYVTPYGLAINTTRGVSNRTKNLNDPFAADVKVVAPNPLKPMFSMIREFRFSDGKVFDFRGDAARSVEGRKGLLSNSNQRGLKGFRTTFSVRRPIGIIGKYRLDWVFVKSYLYDPTDTSATYKFAPHFGETLEEMNENLIEKISDHHPNVLELPLREPNI
ncbi:MAG: endonuclease/exonuclease/phosphatase family protein [Candidatus Omnitrophota bacterium]